MFLFWTVGFPHTVVKVTLFMNRLMSVPEWMHLINSNLQEITMTLVLPYSAPSPPTNLRTRDVTSTSITVTWEPPKYSNGMLLGYEVCYTSNGESPSVASVQNTTVKLTDLKPWAMYCISVRAKTLAGFGEKSIPVMISTLESGMCILRVSIEALDSLCILNNGYVILKNTHSL